MRVRATALGYYNHKRRRPGDVFELRPYEKVGDDGKKIVVSAADQLSSKWMEKVSSGSKFVSKAQLREEQEVEDLGARVDESTGDQDVL